MGNFKLRVALLFCPFGSINQPPVGISCLAAYVEDICEIDTIDLNIAYHKFCLQKSTKNFSSELHFNGGEVLMLEKNLDLNSNYCREFINFWALRLAKCYNIIGFSVFTSNIRFSIKLIEKIKEINSGVIIFCGGPASLNPLEWHQLTELKDKKQKRLVDVAVLYEGEEKFREAIKALTKSKIQTSEDYDKLYSAISNIQFQKPQFINNLNNLPFPEFSRFDLKAYKNIYLPIQGSRGCINNCYFCGEKPFWGYYRYKRGERVFQEIKYHIEKTGVRTFNFCDSLINGKPSEIQKFCELVVNERLKLNWYCLAAINNNLNLNLFKIMKNAGCDTISFGIESGSNKVLKEMNKSYDRNLASKILKSAKSAGISVGTCWFVGYPTETEEDFNESLRFIKENEKYIDEIHFSGSCGIYPNSFLHEHHKEFGIRFSEEGWQTEDGKNTPKIREERIKRFVEFCQTKIREEIRLNQNFA